MIPALLHSFCLFCAVLNHCFTKTKLMIVFTFLSSIKVQPAQVLHQQHTGLKLSKVQNLTDSTRF